MTLCGDKECVQSWKHYGIPATKVEIFRNWYNDISSCVRLDGVDGVPHTNLPEAGVRYVAVHVQYLYGRNDEESDVGRSWMSNGWRGKGSRMGFADDVALLADSLMVMTALVMKMVQVTQNSGINISAKKREIHTLAEAKMVSDFKVCRLEGRPWKQWRSSLT